MKNILKAIPIIASIIFLSGCTGAFASESIITETAEVTAESSTVETTTSDFGPAIDNDDILVYTIDTSIRTDFLEPATYQVISRTAVWTDETRTDVSRYLEVGETVTVMAEVGESSRVYALLDTGEYVLLTKLEVAKTTDPSETSEETSNTAKETSSTAKETSSASETTAAWTETAVSKTVYATGSVNIRSGAGTSYSKVRTASYGEALTVLAETSNGWYKLSDGNYISKSVTSETKPADPTSTPITAETLAPAETATPTETTATATQTTVADRVEAGGTDSIYTGAMEYRASCDFDSIPRDATLDALAQQRAEDLAQAGALDHHAGMPHGRYIESLGTGTGGGALYSHADDTCSATSIGIGRATHYYADGTTFSVTVMEMVY